MVHRQVALTGVAAQQSLARSPRIRRSNQDTMRCTSLQAGHYMDDGLGLSGTGSSPGSAEKGKALMEVQQRTETLKHKCIKVRVFCSPAGLN